MLLPHGLRRSRRVGLGGKFSPPFAHVGGVEGGPPGTGMSACVKGEKLSRVRLAVGEAEGYGQHGGIGGVLPHAAPRCGIVALGGGPKPSCGRVRSGPAGAHLLGTPPRKLAKRGGGAPRTDVLDEWGARVGLRRVLLARLAVQHEGPVLAAVENVVVPVNARVRNHTVRGRSRAEWGRVDERANA